MNQRKMVAVIAGGIFLMVCFFMTSWGSSRYEVVTANVTLTPTAWVYLPYITKQGKIIYASRNLSGHSVAAECNPGGGTDCPCSDDDVAVESFEDHGEVTSNVHAAHTFVNTIGYKKFTETLPNGNLIALGVYTYTGQFSIPVLPYPDINQKENPEAVHMMIQLWDGRDALFPSSKTALEGAIYWELNPWKVDYGKIKVYIKPLILTDTGITLTPGTDWHAFELVVDFVNQEYVSITIDGEFKDLRGMELAQVSHPDWGDEVFLSITTESMAAWPHEDCRYVFTWTTWFRDLELAHSQ